MVRLSGFVGLGWAGFVGLGWVGLGWVGLGWVGLVGWLGVASCLVESFGSGFECDSLV